MVLVNKSLEDSTILRAKALESISKGEESIAIMYYETILDNPGEKNKNVADITNLGALLRRNNRIKDAIKLYRLYRNYVLNDKTLLLNACNALEDEALYEEAHSLIELYCKNNKADESIMIKYATVLTSLGEHVKAHRIFKDKIEQNKLDGEGWIAYGILCVRRSEFEQALYAFTKAQDLGCNEVKMIANRISILKDMGKFEDAYKLFESTKKQVRNTKEVKTAYAGLLLGTERMEEASIIYQELCLKGDHDRTTWLNWAASLRGLKYTVRPYIILKRGLMYYPQDWSLLESLNQLLIEMGELQKAQRILKVHRDIFDTESKDIHFYNRQFLNLTVGDVDKIKFVQEARTWEDRKINRGLCNIFEDTIKAPTKSGRLRIGYVTSDACNHPVGRFLLPILKCHNRNDVEIWLFSGGRHHDWITEKLFEYSDHVVDLQSYNDVQAARVISDIQIDILVDLGGYSACSRIGLFVYRPSPIQISYLGYPAPTYLRCIDGWIGDKVLFGGLDNIDRGAHRRVVIKGGYMAFDAGDNIEINYSSKERPFAFGSFNHSRKLTDKTISLYKDVLKHCKNSILVLKSITFHEHDEIGRIRNRFLKHGVGDERLKFLPWVEGGINHLDLYQNIDIALDPIPYGGATTTCEALWMGVPVVCLAGTGMVGRLSASVLASSGLNKYIARSREEYVMIANHEYQLGERDKRDRLALRNLVKGSELCDVYRLTKELESKYRDLYVTYWDARGW